MIVFEDELEFYKNQKRINILGEEVGAIDNYVKIEIKQIKSITDITSAMQYSLKRNVAQTFEVIATTNGCGITCDRQLLVSMESLIKLIRYSCFYSELNYGIQDLELYIKTEKENALFSDD